MTELSASQLSTFELCPRKWAWSKIEGITLPPNDSAQFGIEVHEHIEKYLRDGIPIDLTKGTGQLALAMLPYAPQPGEASVEDWFYIDFWGHRIRGRKDAERFGVVWDWKTTSDFMWAKTSCPGHDPVNTTLEAEGTCSACDGPLDPRGLCEKSLRSDIAACLYATDSMLKSGLDYAHLRWVYGVRKKPYNKARPLDVTLTRADVTPTLTRVKKLADEIRAIPAGTRALHLPYDVRACSAFGGCPYVGLCNLSPEEKMRSAMNQDLETQKQAFYADAEKLKQQQGGFGYAINPPPQGQQIMNQPPQFAPPPNGQQQFAPPPQQQQFAPPQQQQFAPPPGQQQFQGPPMTQNGTPAHPAWQQQQQPPQFAPPGQQQPQQGGPPPQFAPPGPPQGGPPQFAPPGQQQQPPQGGPPQFTPPGEAVSAKGPGRPKGAKNKKAPTAPTMPALTGEVSRAEAFRFISQGFAMLAACETEDEAGE